MGDFSDITPDAVNSRPAVSNPTVAKKASAKTPHAVTGTKLKVIIEAEAWDRPGTLETMICGIFEIDGITLQGPPSTASIKGISIPMQTSIRREAHSQGWEDVTLRYIAQQVAQRGNISLMYELDDDPHIDRADQRQEADLPFLQRMCVEHGAAMKVANNQIIIFDEAKYEERDAIVVIKRGDNRLLSWSFTQESANVASSAKAVYKDPNTGKLVEDYFAPDEAPAVGNMLVINERPSDLMDAPASTGRRSRSGSSNVADDFADIRADAKGTAQQKAKAALRAQNRSEWTCQLSTVGNPRMCAGATFWVEGFGVYDGKYLADTVVHSLGSGYTNDIKGHRVLGY